MCDIFDLNRANAVLNSYISDIFDHYMLQQILYRQYNFIRKNEEN